MVGFCKILVQIYSKKVRHHRVKLRHTFWILMEVDSVQILAKTRECKGKESGCSSSSSPHMQKPGPLPTATLSSRPVVYQELVTGPSLCALAALAPTRAGRSWAVREYPGIPHWAGSGPADASLEWGNPQCAGCCSELPSGEHSFLPEESQSEGELTSKPQNLPPGESHWWGESSGPGGPTYLPDSWLSGLLQL